MLRASLIVSPRSPFGIVVARVATSCVPIVEWLGVRGDGVVFVLEDRKTLEVGDELLSFAMNVLDVLVARTSAVVVRRLTSSWGVPTWEKS